MNKPVVNYDHKTIQVRRGSTTEWRRYGGICIPAEGEICAEFFQNVDGTRNGNVGIKVGNGSDAYSILPYLITNQNKDDRISNEQINNWDLTVEKLANLTAAEVAQVNEQLGANVQEALNNLHNRLLAIDPDGGAIEINDITGLEDALASKADKSDLEQEIKDREDGDKALQEQIDNFEGSLWTEEDNGSISRDSDVRVNGDVVSEGNIRADRISTPASTQTRDTVNLTGGTVTAESADPDASVYVGSTEFDRKGTTSYIKADGRAWFAETVQAKDFLDERGASIIGRGDGAGGGDSLKFYDEVDFSIGGGYVWRVNSFWSHEEFDTSLEYHPLPTEKHVFGSVEANKIRGFDLGITASDISLKRPESGGPSYLTNVQGPSFFSDAISIETTVFGGINIRGNDAERPPQLPYSPDEKSLQYALTVTHETLGRTVEIDKEGIIRAHQFTDMDGNPIGGGDFDNTHTFENQNVSVGVDNLSAGKFCTAVGVLALQKNTADEGMWNTAVGHNAAMNNTTGKSNTAIGFGTLYNNATGFGLTAIGDGAGPTVDGLTNSTAIGCAAEVDASNKIQLGDPLVTLVHTHGAMQAAEFIGAIKTDKFRSTYEAQSEASDCFVFEVPFQNRQALRINWVGDVNTYGNIYAGGGVIVNGALMPLATNKWQIGTPDLQWTAVYAQNFYKNGGNNPLIATDDMIETLSTLRNATQDETTLEGLRDAIGNAIGGLIEKFEAMQEVNA